MISFTKIDLLFPGMKKYVERFGAQLEFDGFILCLRAGEKLHELSIERIERFFDEDDYVGLNKYLDSMISPNMESA